MGALSATFNPKYRDAFKPLVPGFHFVPYNNFQRLQQAVEEIGDHVAGILLEPIQGEGGVHIGNPDYFRSVRQLCNEKNILLIIDEVQTGFCRTGKMFGTSHFHIEPDMMCIAKIWPVVCPWVGCYVINESRFPPGSTAQPLAGTPWPARPPWLH